MSTGSGIHIPFIDLMLSLRIQTLVVNRRGFDSLHLLASFFVVKASWPGLRDAMTLLTGGDRIEPVRMERRLVDEFAFCRAFHSSNGIALADEPAPTKGIWVRSEYCHADPQLNRKALSFAG